MHVAPAVQLDLLRLLKPPLHLLCGGRHGDEGALGDEGTLGPLPSFTASRTAGDLLREEINSFQVGNKFRGLPDLKS